MNSPLQRPVSQSRKNTPQRLVSLFLWLVLLGLPGLALAQSSSISFPYERQSVVDGTQLSVRISVTPPAGYSVTQVQLTRTPSSATTLVGTLTPPVPSTASGQTFVISWPVSLTQAGTGGFLQLGAVATCSNGTVTTTLTGNRIVTTISSTSCNSGTAVKSFYVQAGAPTSTTNGGSAATPTGSFNNIINNGALIGGSTFRPLPGDIIYFMASPNAYTLTSGNSAGNLALMTRTGLPGCPITIRNRPNERPKLKLTTASLNAILIPAGVNYVDIMGLEIEGLYTDADLATTLPAALTQPGSCTSVGGTGFRTGTPPTNFNNNGILIDGRNAVNNQPHHIRILDNKIHNVSAGGIAAIEADYITIDNNEVYNNSWYTVYGASGISVFHPWNFDSNTGYRNFVRNNKSYGNRLYVPWNVGCKITDGNGIIIDDFLNSQTSSTIQGQVYTGRTLVANNVLFNNGGSGAHAYKGLKTDFVNNTAYLNSQSQGADNPVGEIYAQQADDINIVNNIMRPISGEKTFTTNSGNTNVAYTNNLYLVDATSQVPVTATNTIVAPSTETSVFVLPTTDAATANFQLKAGSSALNTGTNTYVASVATDFLGTTRPQGAGVDIGAYELQSTAVTITSQPVAGSAVCVGAAVSVSVGVSEGAQGYLWYKDGVALTGVASATTATLSLSNVTAADAGSYSVVITASTSLTSSTFSLTVNAPPTASLLPASSTLTCASPSVTLTAGGGTSYTFAGGGTVSSNSLVVSSAGTYSVAVTDVNGCTAAASATVSNDQGVVTATLTPGTATIGCSVTSVTLTAGGGNTGETFTYAFSGGTPLGNNQIVVNTAGTYSVTVTGPTGCTGTATAEVAVNNTPSAVTITATPGLTATTGSSVTLTASGASTYLWNTTAVTAAISTTAAGTFSVTGITNGCSATASATIVRVAAPTVSLLFPQFNSSYLAGRDISIQATATTPTNTTITKVEFYLTTDFFSGTALTNPTYGTKLGEDLSAPYSVTWTAPAFIPPTASRNYQVRAVVTNSLGAVVIQSGTGYAGFTVYSPTSFTSSRNLYVSPSGVNSTTGTTGTLPTTPFQTIQYAADRAAPGDVVHVMAGTYTGTGAEIVAIRRTGTPTQWITFKAYQTDKPKLVLGNNNWNAINVLPAAAYVTIQGLEVLGNNPNLTLPQAQTQPGACEGPNPTATPIARFNGNGISISGGGGDINRPHHITITGNNVHDCAGGGIGGGQCDYVTFENNTVYNNSWYTVYGTSGLNIINAWNYDNNTTDPRIIIRNNRTFGNMLKIAWNIGGTGTNCKFYDGNGIILDNNNAAKNTIGAYTGKFLLENNLSYFNGGRGININYSDNAIIINNTTYQNGQSDGPFGIGIDNELIMQGSTGSRVYNNIFYAKPGENPSSVSSSTDVLHNNNLTFGGSGSGYFTGSQNITGQDPLFIDAPTSAMSTTANFRLANSSPALNAGSSITGQFSTSDIIGIARPQGVGADIGAYEQQVVTLSASNSAVCPGTTVSVSVSVNGAVQSYQWYKDGTELTGVASATTATLSLSNVTTTDAGSYSAVILTGGESLTSGAFSLTVNARPTVSIGPVSGILTCANPSLTLTATSSATGLVWSDNSTSTTLVVNSANTYSVVATSVDGCTAVATATIASNTAAPTSVSLTSGTLTCAQTSVTLTASSTDGTSYSFSGGAPLGSNQVVVSTAGTYTVTTSGPNGCTALATATVETSTAAPVASLSASSTTACTPATLTLTASGGDSYTFSAGATRIGTTNQATVTQSGSYSVMVSNAGGCTATASVSVTISQRPDAPMLTGVSRTISTTSNTPLSLTPFVSATGGNTLSFSGVNGVLNPPNATISQAGVQSFSATQTNAGGCVSLPTPFTITVQHTNTTAAPVSQTVCRSSSVVLTVEVAGATKYEWYKNGTTVANKMTEIASIQKGTNTASLTLVSVQTTADYYCKVTRPAGVTNVGPIQVVVNYGCTAPGARLAGDEEPQTPLTIRLLPNPILNGQLRAVVEGAAGQPLSVQLTDTKGRMVRQQTWPHAEAAQLVEWTIISQPSGLYLLQAQTPGQRITTKVIKAD